MVASIGLAQCAAGNKRILLRASSISLAKLIAKPDNLETNLIDQAYNK